MMLSQEIKKRIEKHTKVTVSKPDFYINWKSIEKELAGIEVSASDERSIIFRPSHSVCNSELTEIHDLIHNRFSLKGDVAITYKTKAPQSCN